MNNEYNKGENLMSKGALSELFNASIDKFENMVKVIPASERKKILKIFQERYAVLGERR